MGNQVQLDPHGEMLLRQYRELRPTLQQLADEACSLLRQALKEQGIYVTAIEHRVKTEKSLRGKLELKGAKYKSIDDVTDLVGLRVITFYTDDVDKVAVVAKGLFDIDWQESVDKRKLHQLDSFGYNSLHYICRLREGDAISATKNPRFELQMRTALQHVWSTIEHDTGYKGDVKIPHEYMRQFNRMAGMLELMDEEFSRLRNVLVDYRRQMLALEASGQLDSVDLNSETFRRYLEAHPFDRLNQRIAAINQAELYPVPIMPYFRVLQDLGMETLGEVNRLVEEYSDDAYRLAVSQLGATDLDILSENIGIQNLCYVYVLKQGGGPAGLCRILDVLNGYQPGNMAIAKKLFEQAQKLSFE
jgi:ppGpp synthetase/RelA/SpoT-type nucleotidyltranferase